MKRTVFGFCLLLILLLAGLSVQKEMALRHRPIAEMLTVAGQEALEEDWHSAEVLAAAARRSWQKSWTFSTAFADHEPMEEIDSLFARLEIFLLERDMGEFSASCGELSRKIYAMADAHKLSWPNFL